MSAPLRPVLFKTLRTFGNMLPVLLGMLLLTSLVLALIPQKGWQSQFGRHESLDVLVGAVLGSVVAGNPLAGYILGGELLAGGISLIAVTALIVAWVSVSLVQLPAEALLFGRRFAITRNLLGFLSAITIAYLTLGALQLLN